jgi:hypothetical protein
MFIGQGILSCRMEARFMRSVLIAIAAFAVSAPAFAEDRPSTTTRDLEAVADTLNNPATQKAVTGALQGILGALLDMPIDGIAKAIEPMNDGKKIKMKGRTLREIAAKDDKNFDKKLDAGSKSLVAGLGALSGALAKMAPQLEEAMDKMGDAIDKVEKSVPATR